MRIACGNQLSPTQNLIAGGAQASAKNFTAATDPDWASVILLAGNDNAADATTTFLDQSSAARTITGVGNAQYDTAQAPAGMTSSILLDGAGDYLTLADDAAWTTSGSRTIEMWVRFASVGNTRFVRHGTNWNWFLEGGTHYIQQDNGGGGTVSVAWSPSQDTWYPIAVEWDGTNRSLYLSGTRVATSASAGNPFDSDSGLVLGLLGTDASINGWVASIRITDAARMSGAASYTVPTLPLPTS